MYMNTPTWLSHTSVDFPQSIIKFYKRLRQFSPIARFRSDSNRRFNSFAGCHLRPLGHRTRKSSIQRVQLPRIGSPPTTSYIFRSIKPSSVEVLRSHASFTNQFTTPLAIIGRTFVLYEGIEPSLPEYPPACIHTLYSDLFRTSKFSLKANWRDLWTVVCKTLPNFCKQSAQNEIWTHMSLWTHRPQRCAYTNSATWAFLETTSLLPESNRWPSYYE